MSKNMYQQKFYEEKTLDELIELRKITEDRLETLSYVISKKEQEAFLSNVSKKGLVPKKE
jgi:hypothetical protein